MISHYHNETNNKHKQPTQKTKSKIIFIPIKTYLMAYQYLIQYLDSINFCLWSEDIFFYITLQTNIKTN